MFCACQGNIIVNHKQRRGSGLKRWGRDHVFRTVKQGKRNGYYVASVSKQITGSYAPDHDRRVTTLDYI
jgi:hypothetical protein